MHKQNNKLGNLNHTKRFMTYIFCKVKLLRQLNWQSMACISDQTSVRGKTFFMIGHNVLWIGPQQTVWRIVHKHERLVWADFAHSFNTATTQTLNKKIQKNLVPTHEATVDW